MAAACPGAARGVPVLMHALSLGQPQRCRSGVTCGLRAYDAICRKGGERSDHMVKEAAGAFASPVHYTKVVLQAGMWTRPVVET